MQGISEHPAGFIVIICGCRAFGVNHLGYISEILQSSDLESSGGNQVGESISISLLSTRSHDTRQSLCRDLSRTAMQRVQNVG